MALFGRKREHFEDDPNLPDDQWLAAGRRRYDDLIGNHYGSPETIAAGGTRREDLGDIAASLFFYQKAIDLLHTLYVSSAMGSRQPGDRDRPIIDGYLETLADVRARRSGAPVADSVREVTHRLRTISSACQNAGLDAILYVAALDRLGRDNPDVNVDDVLW